MSLLYNPFESGHPVVGHFGKIEQMGCRASRWACNPLIVVNSCNAWGSRPGIFKDNP